MSSPFGDQASGLRRMLDGRRLRVVSFVAASDGVGKTHVVANLAVALAALGRSVLVLDENCGQDNVAGFFGSSDGHDLLDVIQGRCGLEQVVFAAAENLLICPAARALRQLGGFGAEQQRYLVDALASLPEPPDTILIDAAHDHPLGFSPVGLIATSTVVVLSASSHAITGAYALIKGVAQLYGRRRFSVLINKVRSQEDALQIFENLSRVAAQRGVAEVSLAGIVPHDPAMAFAAANYRPVVDAVPQAPAAVALRQLAAEVERWVSDAEPSGVGHFMQQLVHLTQKISPHLLHAR